MENHEKTITYIYSTMLIGMLWYLIAIWKMMNC